ncbi:MAG TPA: hypothetical protein VNK45_03315 [Candidatus Acidoferrales bacterium]|nr:hypothetical protein [Candidatus Acidoferrales bacterium]
MNLSAASIHSAKRLFRLMILLLFSVSGVAWGHGGVSIEDDMCIMQVGPYRAHFTGYIPDRRATQEFCEDIPDTGRAIFAIDFINDELRRMQVDFRIIRDVNNVGIRATYDDLGTKEDIERATIYYRPPEVLSTGTFNASHTFPEKGHFIGIVTARHPETGKEYVSVFPFAVGIFRWGPIVTRLVLIIVLVGAVAAFFITRAMRK